MFNVEIRSLCKNMDSIVSFIDLLEPVLLEKIDEKLKRDAKDLRILNLAFSKLKSSEEDDNLTINEEVENEIRKNFDGDFLIEKDDKSNSIKLRVKGKDGERFDKALNGLRELNEQKELLYKSCLMNIISSIESYFVDILNVYFKENRNEIINKLIVKKDKFFSFEQLESFDEIEDARIFLIDTKIEDLIRSSFVDWIEFLKSKIGISMGYLENEKDKITEIFQRRNLFVHNKGVVNSIYLSRVNPKLTESVKKGEQIILNREYLEESVDSLELTFLLIAFEIWKKKRKNDEERFELLTELIQKNLDLNRWNVVKGLSTFLKNEGECSQSFRLFAKINFWLASKRLGDFDLVKEDVNAEDFSAYSLDFIICKYALLDEYDKVYELFPEVIEKGIRSFEELDGWPIFDEIKENEKYSELIERYCS